MECHCKRCHCKRGRLYCVFQSSGLKRHPRRFAYFYGVAGQVDALRVKGWLSALRAMEAREELVLELDGQLGDVRMSPRCAENPLVERRYLRVSSIYRLVLFIDWYYL